MFQREVQGATRGVVPHDDASLGVVPEVHQGTNKHLNHFKLGRRSQPLLLGFPSRHLVLPFSPSPSPSSSSLTMYKSLRLHLRTPHRDLAVAVSCHPSLHGCPYPQRELGQPLSKIETLVAPKYTLLYIMLVALSSHRCLPFLSCGPRSTP